MKVLSERITSLIGFRKVVVDRQTAELRHPFRLDYLSPISMATLDMSDKEMEASISLLHMMQPFETITEVTSLKSDSTLPRDALYDSLMKVVAKQASDELSLPRIAAQKKIQQRGARLTALSRELTLEELRPHFDRPIVEVAREFGICTTFLKKICRRCGIKRWPHRQIRSLNRTIQMLEQVESMATNPDEKARYGVQIEELKEKQRAVMENPDASGKLHRMKKYAAPKRATDPMSTAAGQNSESFVRPMTRTSDSDAKNLSALAIAVDSISSALRIRSGDASEDSTWSDPGINSAGCADPFLNRVDGTSPGFDDDANACCYFKPVLIVVEDFSTL